MQQDAPHNKKMIIIAAACIVAVVAGVGTWMAWQATQQSATQEPAAPANTEATDMTAPQAAEEAQVEITADGFTPAEITVDQGTNVVWINTTAATQTIMPTGESQPADFGNTVIAPQESYVFTFDTPGNYSYASKANPNIRGVVHVNAN